MTLNNLVGKTLEKISPDYNAIKRLAAAAKRNIADAKIMAVSAEIVLMQLIKQSCK